METNLPPSAGTGSSGMATSGFSQSTSDTYSAPGAGERGAGLRTELSNLKSDLDTLLSRSGTMSDSELSQEHARLMAKFTSLKSAARGIAAQANQQFSRVASEANRQFTHGVDVTTEYVKEKPMQSVAVAAGAGLLLGMLFGRR